MVPSTGVSADGRQGGTTAGQKPMRVGPILTAIVLTGLLLWMFLKTSNVFLLVFLASLLALYLGAVADWIARRTQLPRPIAFWLGAVLTLSVGAGIIGLLVPPVVQQTQELLGLVPSIVGAFQREIAALSAKFPSLAKQIGPIQDQVLNNLPGQISSVVGDVVPRVFSVLEAITVLFTVVVMGIYLALEPAVYREWVIALFPPVHRDLVRDIFGDMGSKLRDYIVAQLLTMVILGALTAVGLWVIRVPFWLTFGVLSAVAAIIPVYGVLLSTTVPALFVISQPNGLVRAALVLALGVAIHVIEGNFVAPNIMSKRVDLPPVLTMIAVLVFGELLGPVGLLVSIPLLVVIMVLVHRLLVARLYEGRGFRRARRDGPITVRVPAAEGGGTGGVAVSAFDGVPLDIIALSERTRAGPT
ncbi:MAG TPA: AI-2E family transporter [Gemmatimonadaceae bacterium]|nr:AI-2E family transporter [Gemmatimonadaceae bacterium]